MATWVDPIDSQTDPDAPLTSELGKRWDYNVIAALEGASGAQRILGEAVATPGNGLPVLSVSASDDYNVTTGLGAVSGATSTEDVEVTAITYNITTFTGSLRFKATISGTGGANPRLRLYVNSVMVYEATSAGSYVRDQPIIPTDVVEWRIAEVSGTASSVTSISSISVTGTNAYQEQPVYIQAINNV